MSLRTLSDRLTEAKYAKSDRKGGGGSPKQAKHWQRVANTYHRAVRRSQREVIEAALIDLGV